MRPYAGDYYRGRVRPILYSLASAVCLAVAFWIALFALETVADVLEKAFGAEVKK